MKDNSNPIKSSMTKASSDALVLGAGPGALSIAAALGQENLKVTVLSDNDPLEAWPYTYGIWGEEVDDLGLSHLLEHRWKNTVSYFGDGITEKGKKPICHNFDYGLFNQSVFQKALLEKCKKLTWFVETAQDIQYKEKITEVTCSSGKIFTT